MKNNRKAALAVAITAVLAVGACSSDSSGDSSGSGKLVFVSFGGAYQEAQSVAMVKPYAKTSGVKVTEDGPTDTAKIQLQVKTKNVKWDVIDAEPYFPLQECGKSAMKLDYDVIDTSKMDPALVSDCAVANMSYSYIFMYNTKLFGDNPPQSWTDFFDTKKYPGKRAIRDSAAGGALEAALLGDGVTPADLFPLDLDRAFRKLDSVRKDLVIADGATAIQQQMESGEVAMAIIPNGRGYDAVKNGAPFAAQWNQNLLGYDVFMVPTGAPNAKEAMKFINYAIGAEAQGKLTENISYGPINKDAKPDVDAELTSFLPSDPANAKVAVIVDQNWWAKNLDSTTAAWAKWATS